MKPIAVLCLASALTAQTGPPNAITLEATGTELVPPQVYHVLMKMEWTSGRAADASSGGERQVRDFIQAVEARQFAGLTWRLANHVYTALPGPYQQGTAYSRNIVFTLPNPPAREDRERIVAQIQDLGAKYNSHCVTCIGSG